MRRILYGPLTRTHTPAALAADRPPGEWVTFGEGADIPWAPADSWADLARRFPPGWAPDAVLAWVPYAPVPAFASHAPVPVVALAADWNLLWHPYRHLLPVFDAVLTDAPGVEALRRAGLGHAYPANLFGLGRDYLA